MSDDMDCIDCGMNTTELKEPIVSLIKREISSELGLSSDKYASLCLDCFEKRIGRKLKPSDIEATFGWWINERASERLRDRVGKMPHVGVATRRSGFERSE